MRIQNISSLLFSLAIMTMFIFAPFVARAENGVNATIIGFGAGLGLSAILGANMAGQSGGVEHFACVKETSRRLAKKQPPPSGDFPCIVPASNAGGVVVGVCFKKICKGVSFTGVGGSGGGATGLDLVAKILGGLMGKLMQGGGAGSSPPPSSFPTTPTGGTGCQGSFFQTSDISQISNPCAQYTPAVSTEIPTDTGSCSVLNETLGLCTNNPNNCPSVPVVDCAPGNHPVSGGQDASGCVLQDTCAPDTATTPSATSNTTGRVIFATSTGTVVVPPGGLRGDINTQVTGATVVAGGRDTQGNIEVAGFYGSETFNGGSQGLVGSWCKSRPWATNFLSKIITPTFFDNLCTSRGYQVGTPPAAPAVVLQQTPKPKPKPAVVATTTAATATPGVTPKVDIWAVPASVPLGGRTSVFWNTQGVTNCTETSASGGFSQNSLSGGAATQPITAATTFSISCLAPDGSPVTDSVTVNLKI